MEGGGEGGKCTQGLETAPPNDDWRTDIARFQTGKQRLAISFVTRQRFARLMKTPRPVKQATHPVGSLGVL